MPGQGKLCPGTSSKLSREQTDLKIEMFVAAARMCTLKQKMTKASPPPFFERQREALCGLHALNNALGAEKFTREQLTAACNLYLQESDDVAEARKEHIGRGGEPFFFWSTCHHSSKQPPQAGTACKCCTQPFSQQGFQLSTERQPTFSMMLLTRNHFFSGGLCRWTNLWELCKRRRGPSASFKIKRTATGRRTAEQGTAGLGWIAWQTGLRNILRPGFLRVSRNTPLTQWFFKNKGKKTPLQSWSVCLCKRFQK